MTNGLGNEMSWSWRTVCCVLRGCKGLCVYSVKPKRVDEVFKQTGQK